MAEYIKREDAIDAMADTLIFAERIGYADAEDAMSDIPAADVVERKRGHWMRYGVLGEPDDNETCFWQCDQCLCTEAGYRKEPMNFCPNCGADMREEDGDT